MIYFIFLIVIFIITLLLEFTRDFYKSLYYCFKNRKNPFQDFVGMVGFCGYYGQGKSMALTHTINKYKALAEKHNEELRIYTNYHYKSQTSALTCLDDIEKICDEKRKTNDKSYTIFAIDELQNCLNSRNWNDSKKLESLLPIFTMTRKLRVMFLYTSPVLSMSDKNIRISSKAIYLCRKVNRYFFIRYRLNPIELEGNLKEIKLSFFPSAHTLLQDNIMNSYDSFAFIETLQKQDYLKHNETDSQTIVNNFNNIKKLKK